MFSRLSVAVLATALFASGCFVLGFKQIRIAGKTTYGLSGTPANYARLEGAARTAGWSAARDQGGYDLTVQVGPGRELIFTTNKSNGIMAYNCRGLGSGECKAAANKLLGPAFAGVLQ